MSVDNSSMERRFVGVHDYPLCQDGEWITSMTASLYLLDAGLFASKDWLSTDMEMLADRQLWNESDRGDVRLVGRESAAWNPYLCVTLLPANSGATSVGMPDACRLLLTCSPV